MVLPEYYQYAKLANLNTCRVTKGKSKYMQHTSTKSIDVEYRQTLNMQFRIYEHPCHTCVH